MTKQKPATWTIGTTGKDGFTVVRVRQFFAVLKKVTEDKPTEWAVEFIDGKRAKADSSTDAGAKGRDYRDAQQAKGVTVERAPRTAKAPAKKAPAKKAPAAKAPAKKAPAKKASAKDAVNGRGTSKPSAKKAAPAAPARTRKPRATR